MDTIANMFTAILNAQRVQKERVAVPYSRFKEDIARFLADQGRLGTYRVQEGPRPKLVLTLAYKDDGSPAIQGIERLSTPGRRRYVRSTNVPYTDAATGAIIVSTPKGLMEGSAARAERLGGELIASIW